MASPTSGAISKPQGLSTWSHPRCNRTSVPHICLSPCLHASFLDCVPALPPISHLMSPAPCLPCHFCLCFPPLPNHSPLVCSYTYLQFRSSWTVTRSGTASLVLYLKDSVFVLSNVSFPLVFPRYTV